MSVAVKTCGLTSEDAVAAAMAGGARFVGFIFYGPSPRDVTPERAARLAQGVAPGVRKVGVLVDPDDATLERILRYVPLDLLQLHGRESPERVAQVKRRFAKPVMKAVPVAGAADVEAARAYFGVADWLLFDAKPPPAGAGVLPGGNGLALDWELLRERRWPLPWMLSGGLSVDNLVEAQRISGAEVLDVSTGIEARPGLKDPAKIRAFLALAGSLPG